MQKWQRCGIQRCPEYAATSGDALTTLNDAWKPGANPVAYTITSEFMPLVSLMQGGLGLGDPRYTGNYQVKRHSSDPTSASFGWQTSMETR